MRKRIVAMFLVVGLLVCQNAFISMAEEGANGTDSTTVSATEIVAGEDEEVTEPAPQAESEAPVLEEGAEDAPAAYAMSSADPAADPGTVSGTYANGMTWEITGEVLTISGNGVVDTHDYDYSGGIEDGINYGEMIKEVIINEGATEIGEGAFDGYYYRKSSTPGYNGDTAKYWSFRKVSLPSTVTKIDRSAFSNCHSLEEINIPEGVTKIGSVTFWRCYSLKQINIPDSVIEIEENAFGESGIEKMMLPDSVVKMDGAFSDCYDLEQINIPDGITEIGDETFFRCHNLREIHIPDRVTRIGDLAMYGTGLKEIHIPDSVTEIGVAAFGACYGLKKIVIPGSVKKIGHSAFSYGELEEIIFLGDVPEILEKMKNDYGLYGDYVGEVFQDNTGIAYYPASNPTWTEEARMAIGSKLDWIVYGELKILPEVTDNVYVLGGSNGATIACSGEFKDFVDVYMDDVLVDKENYTVAEGSTILTFASKYLNTLSVGVHKVTLNYTYGSIDTQLEIVGYGNGASTEGVSNAEGTGTSGASNKTAAEDVRITKKSPQTGDENSALPWLILCFAAVCGGTAVSVRRKRTDSFGKLI